MKVIFAHDHRFIREAGTFWTESQFEAALWSRYLTYFSALTVLGREGSFPVYNSANKLEMSSTSGVSFQLFPNLSTFKGLTLSRQPAIQKMHKLMLDHDAVIARLPSEIGLLAIQVACAHGKPWAVEVVGCPWDGLWNYGSISGKLYAPIARLRMRDAVARAQHVLYVTENFLQCRYPTRAGNTIAASNVRLVDFSDAPLLARSARLSSLRHSPIRLGLIGTLRGRFKGIQTLLAALASVQGDIPPVTLHILGGGDSAPWKAEVARHRLSDIVSFDGTLPAGDRVLNWLDKIDIYLQPSLKEGLPRALIEAMSRACPAIASVTAGIPELLAAEDLFRPNDSAALANLLKRRVGDIDWMMNRASRNWRVAHGYRQEILDERRSQFWARFRDSVANSILSK